MSADFPSAHDADDDITALHEPIVTAPTPQAGAISLNKALRSDDADLWIEAVDKERLDLPTHFADGRPAFVRVHRRDVPPDATIYRSLFTCSVKRSGKHKARWVVDGRRTISGPTSDTGSDVVNSSPTCLSSSVSLALAMVAQFGWSVRQYDVEGAYLCAGTVRTFYVTNPAGWTEYLQQKHGYVDHEPGDYLHRVDKNAYGAPDGGLAWYERLCAWATNIGYVASPVDRCLFVLTKLSGGARKVCVMLVYIDDLLLAGDKDLAAHTAEELKREFSLSEGGQDYLGLEIDVQDGRVHVSQQAYARKIVDRFGYGESHAVPTPLTTGFTAGSTDLPRGGAGLASTLNFSDANGAIGYLTKTMPTLLFAFGVFSSVMCPSAAAPTAPTSTHRAALARCLRFIGAYGHCGVLYKRAAEFTLMAVGDASHGQEIHQVAAGFCKSRSEGAVLACGAVIAAFSSIQQATALSTFESELYALVATVRLLLALRRLVIFILGVTLSASIVLCDNAPVILQLRKRDLRQRTRHIRVHMGFLIDAIENGEIEVRHVPTALNAANTLTVAGNSVRFARSFASLHGTPMSTMNDID